MATSSLVEVVEQALFGRKETYCGFQKPFNNFFMPLKKVGQRQWRVFHVA